MPQNPMIRALVIFLIGLLILLLGLAGWLYMQPRGQLDGGSFDSSTTGQESSLGVDYSLTSQDGTAVSRSDFAGSFRLYYFGYTFCPDVCPFDVSRNADAIDILAEMGISATPVFISIDPERDTVDVVADYSANMHEKMIALTGSEEQVAAASQAYKTYFKAHKDGTDEYLVDHSTFTYLVLPGHGFVDFFRRDVSAQEMAERTACFVGNS